MKQDITVVRLYACYIIFIYLSIDGYFSYFIVFIIVNDQRGKNKVQMNLNGLTMSAFL